jgi:hypothetical protein
MSVAAILRQAIRQVDLPGPLPNELPGGIDVSDVRLRDPVGEIGAASNPDWLSFWPFLVR